MSQIVNSMDSSNAWSAEEDAAAMSNRIFRNMCAAVVIAVLISAVIAPWRVTTGLLLGGMLSLVNHHWLQRAIAAAFSPSIAGARPKIEIARYILRYFIIGATVAAAYLLDIISLTATLFGLCSFVVALLVEAFMQIYFVIVERGEIK